MTVRVTVSSDGGPGDHWKEIDMNLYAIRRRNGWPTPEDLQVAALRSAEEGVRRRDQVRAIRT